MEMEDDFMQKIQDKERFIPKQNNIIKEQDKLIKPLQKQLQQAKHKNS
ncbi:MAG: hypothetical protein LBF88_10505 [Planctomycetaceae bacterium]|jgi:hypothetical protein|nr:hypothetical protein [Planctomycetaceae bacterium]